MEDSVQLLRAETIGMQGCQSAAVAWPGPMQCVVILLRAGVLNLLQAGPPQSWFIAVGAPVPPPTPPCIDR